MNYRIYLNNDKRDLSEGYVIITNTFVIPEFKITMQIRQTLNQVQGDGSLYFSNFDSPSCGFPDGRSPVSENRNEPVNTK